MTGTYAPTDRARRILIAVLAFALAAAYGSMSVHRDGDALVIDDPAHQPVEERHVHRDRTIHTEAIPDDHHRGG